MAQSNRFASADTCAYCNCRPSEPGDGDHVLPRCLFGNKSDSTITVPACMPCNGEKSRSEDYVRDWLCGHGDVDLWVVPRKVFDAFMRSDARGSSKLARTARNQGRYRPIYTPHGLYAGKALTVRRGGRCCG
jgi:hypothetical protein